MAIIDLPRYRRPREPARSRPDLSAGTNRAQRRGDSLAEVAKTMLILMLIAIGIVILRIALVAAYGLLH